MTVVLGLGNPVRGDDAAGLRVAEALQGLLRERPIPGVEVRTSTRAGFEVIDLLAGADRAVIVDCLVTAVPRPGLVHSLDLAACRGSARLVGAHDLPLGDVFALARETGIAMPERVEIYGIEGQETLEIGEGLSPEVATAVGTLAAEIHGRLAVLAVNAQCTMQNAQSGGGA